MQIRLDMHIHSKYSHDGCETVEEIVSLAKRKGMNALTITDHDSIESYKESKAFASEDFLVIPGIEYTTTRGHVLVYFIEKHADSFCAKNENGKYKFEDIIRFAEENDGIAFSAHIFKHAGRPAPVAAFSDVIDAVTGLEIYNGRCSGLYAHANAAARAAALTGHKPFSAGSDGHAKREMFRAYRILEFDNNHSVTLNAIKAKLRQPEGSYFIHPTSATKITYTKLLKSIHSRNARRVTKYILRIGFCLLFDAVRSLRSIFTKELKPRALSCDQ